jgi:hypothetical protein
MPAARGQSDAENARLSAFSALFGTLCGVKKRTKKRRQKSRIFYQRLFSSLLHNQTHCHPTITSNTEHSASRKYKHGEESGWLSVKRPYLEAKENEDFKLVSELTHLQPFKR